MERVVKRVQESLIHAAELNDDEARAETLQALFDDVCAEIEDEVRSRFLRHTACMRVFVAQTYST